MAVARQKKGYSVWQELEPKQTGICKWVGREARQVGYLEDVQRTEVTHSAYAQSSILGLFAKYKKNYNYMAFKKAPQN